MTRVTATYRLQLRREFGFDEAVAVVPYLAKLGISHLYLSPMTQAVAGSVHGYDVVDPTRVNDELGGPEAFDRLRQAVADHGMGIIVDVVPNHMAIAGKQNQWWWDVLRHGRHSAFAKFFDIDWNPPESRLRNVVVLPVLGDHYGRVLERDELKLIIDSEGELVLEYFDQHFPIDPTSTGDGFDVETTNGDIELLDQLIEKQNYRLAYWHVASEELGYRRFFDVDTLVALNNEDPEVFETTHALVLDWLRNGVVDGVRIDHIDGLRDPLGYLRRLRDVAPATWIGVEKILGHDEKLPASWPVNGTTGYEAAALVDGLFVEPTNESAFDDIYRDLVGDESTFAEVVATAKKYVVQNILGSDVARITNLLVKVCESNRRFRDFTRGDLRAAVEALLVSMPVYRTYVVAETSQLTSADVSVVESAVERARALSPDTDVELFDLLAGIFRLEITGDDASEFLMRFQQLSGPVTAKSVEDTAFYRYVRFAMANEVGNEPSHWSSRTDDFHEAASERQRSSPLSMNGGSTHDSKRSADVRSRLAVLSEMPDRWREAVERWMSSNEVHRQGEGGAWPDRPTEYLLYQTLVGAHPLTPDRAVEYMTKAIREAKVHTAWTTPNVAYDEAIERFIRSAMTNGEFTEDVESFVDSIASFSHLNTLSSTAIRFTMPGVPDTYQGDELWNFTLVDPDNRKLVDYTRAEKRLSQLDDMSVEEILDDPDSGLAKLLVVARCGRLRLNRPESFNESGDYSSLRSSGEKSANVVAFSRSNSVVTIAPRLTVALDGDWGDTEIDLPDGTWRNIFTGDHESGGSRSVAELTRRFPVVVLEKNDG